MKKIFSFFAVLLCMAVGYAQNPLVATLNHGDSVSVFYGYLALKNAYEASTHGDVITLSSGGFESVNIEKNITIRGAGMEMDTVNNIAPTVLQGSFTISGVPDSIDAEGHFILEGIYSNGSITLGNSWDKDSIPVENVQFIRCRLDDASLHHIHDVSCEAFFFQCKIARRLYLASNSSHANCISCYIENPEMTGTLRNKHPYFTLTNCIVKKYGGSISHSFIYNCILWGNKELSSSSTPVNCLGISTSKNDFFKDIYPNNNYGTLPDSIANTIFKTYRGEYSDTETFELTDEAKAKYLGTDGTEIGIYGGNMPFTPESTVPQIKKFNVAPKSTEDGKLSVEVEVSAAQ